LGSLCRKFSKSKQSPNKRKVAQSGHPAGSENKDVVWSRAGVIMFLAAASRPKDLGSNPAIVETAMNFYAEGFKPTRGRFEWL
jgi:hypothetical protein